MHPRDLLSLARTTRAFRAFLMNPRSARLSWRAAREGQVKPPMPECPSFLSEPAYANLVFGSVCQVRAHMVCIPLLPMRVCLGLNYSSGKGDEELTLITVIGMWQE